MPGWFSMKLHVELNVNTMDALSLLLKCRIMTPSLTGLSLKLTGICRRWQEGSLLRSILADYLLVKKRFIVLNKYYIPKTLAESVDKKGRIRLRITAFEVRANYTYSKMKYLLTAIGYLPEQRIKQRSSYDRLQTIRYSTTRNRLAACIAFVSAILFLASGYKANIEIYNLVAKEVFAIQTLREFWNFVIVA